MLNVSDAALVLTIFFSIQFSCPTGEIKHVLYISKPKILFVSSTNYRTYYELMKNTPFIRRFVLYADKNVRLLNDKRHIHFNKIIDANIDFDQHKSFVCNAQHMKKHLALIFASSGTTGLPKGVAITQYNLLIGQAQLR